MYAPLAVLLATLAPQAAWAFTFKGYVPLDSLLFNVTLSPSSRVVLDHSSTYGLIRQDGTFELFDLSEGIHVLTPQIPEYVFPSYLLILSSKPQSQSADSSTPQPPSDLIPHLQILHLGKSPLPAGSSQSLPYPLAIRPLAKEGYYTPRGGVDVLGMLKNPIVLMMLMSGLMMFAMPKIMASMEADPEMKKEMMEARRRMTGMQSGLTGGLSSILRGGESTAPPAPPAKVENAAPASVAVSRGGGGARGNGGPQRRRGK